MMIDVALQIAKPQKVKEQDKRWLVTGFSVLFFTFFFLMGWAALAPLQTAVVASGRISVASLNKTVQHLDGGQVAAIAVADGDMVKAGDLLFSFDRKPLEIERERVRGQLLEAQANLERLNAEHNAAIALAFSRELQQQAVSSLDKEILATQQHLFQYRRQSLNTEQDVLQQRLNQLKTQSKGTEQLLKTQKRRLQLLNADLIATQKLAAKKMVSRAQLRERQGRKVELEGEIAEQRSEITRLQESARETQHQIALQVVQYKKEITANQRELQAQKIRLLAEQQNLAGKLSRIDVRAPVSGKVKGFDVVTQGAVIGAGKQVMEIVPLDKTFTISARISPIDIDAVYSGLKAEVKLPVFDGSQQFPPLWANLEDVSTDTYQGQEAQDTYYKANLVLSEQSVETLDALGLKLLSGMPADLYIKTGQRTMLDYLVKPMSDMLARAFNEA